MAEKITSLRQALWNSADQLRGQMDANDYKNYLLGLIFYKHLSDKLLLAVCDNLEEHFNTFTDTQKIFEDAYQDEDLKDDLISVVTGDLGYFIEPTLTFEKLIQDVYHNTFQLESLAQGFRDIEQSGEDFENLFKDIDLYSKKLGSTPQKQNQTIANVMKTLNEIDFESVDGDTLGDAYEYLIGEFASESGKKAGEFYTPQAVSHLMTQIVFSGREDQKGMTLYDPAMESGTLLLNAKKYSHQSDTVSYYGQEINTSTYNLARMNMMLHGVAIENQHLSNADTLDADWPTDEPTNFDGGVDEPTLFFKMVSDCWFLNGSTFFKLRCISTKIKS